MFRFLLSFLVVGLISAPLYSQLTYSGWNDSETIYSVIFWDEFDQRHGIATVVGDIENPRNMWLLGADITECQTSPLDAPLALGGRISLDVDDFRGTDPTIPLFDEVQFLDLDPSLYHSFEIDAVPLDTGVLQLSWAVEIPLQWVKNGNNSKVRIASKDRVREEQFTITAEMKEIFLNQLDKITKYCQTE